MRGPHIIALVAFLIRACVFVVLVDVVVDRGKAVNSFGAFVRFYQLCPAHSVRLIVNVCVCVCLCVSVCVCVCVLD